PSRDAGVRPGPVRAVTVAEGRDELVRRKHFVTELGSLAAGVRFEPDSHACQLWICIEGEAMIGSETVRAGEVWLLPDEGAQPAVQSAPGAKFLRTWCAAS